MTPAAQYVFEKIEMDHIILESFMHVVKILFASFGLVY